MVVVAFLVGLMSIPPILYPNPSDAKTSRTYAVRYSPGVMARVARKRGMPVITNMVAVNDCRRVGQWVLANVNDKVGWFRVTDCSHPRDAARHRRQGLVIELGHNAAEIYFPKGRGNAPAYLIRFAPRPPTQ